MVVERYGYLAKQFTVFGQHVHVGCAERRRCDVPLHLLTRYVPHFIALSAASPYYQEEDTAFQSSRLTAVSAFPLVGHMPVRRRLGGVRRVLRQDEGASASSGA